MNQLLGITRTVVFSQQYAITSDQCLTPVEVNAVGSALSKSDLGSWAVLSESSTVLPLLGSNDDALLVRVNLGPQPTITIDNDLTEVLEVDASLLGLSFEPLDGKLESIATCQSARVQSFKFFVPELFRNAEFLQWLETSKAMTMHQRGTGIPHWDDWADVVIFVDPSLSGEGSDSDMPGHDLVVDRIKKEIGNGPFSGYHFPVVLTNLDK
jgi:hypothetical protein